MPEILAALSILTLLFLSWKMICLVLRSKRFQYISSLDPTQDCLLLCKITNFVEFPLINHKAYEFALFKTFPVPSISKLLQSTQQFSPKSVTKRYDDTVILIQEFALHHVDSPRGSLAIRRLNYIHAQYNISNADFLYTLSLFMLEQIRFCDKYGFRRWSEGEKRAHFAIWHDIGVRMGMKEIPKSLEDMDKFSRQYEAQNMRYADSNRAIGDATLDLLLSQVPAFIRPVATRAVFALFDEMFVDAMGYPRQPRWLTWCVESSLRLCAGTLVRWVLPPRPMTWSRERIECGEAEEGDSVHKLRYQAYKPWTYPEGYRISEMGSVGQRNVAKAWEGGLLCPFSLSKKLD